MMTVLLAVKKVLTLRLDSKNDLRVLDGQLKVTVRPLKVHRQIEPYCFLPDTLLILNKKVNPNKDTEILIADSIFPKINMEYEIEVQLSTPEQQTISQKEKLNYYYQKDYFDFQLLKDSIRFEYFENGIKTEMEVSITGYDAF